MAVGTGLGSGRQEKAAKPGGAQAKPGKTIKSKVFAVIIITCTYIYRTISNEEDKEIIEIHILLLYIFIYLSL